jgi:hypothetical protein
MRKFTHYCRVAFVLLVGIFLLQACSKSSGSDNSSTSSTYYMTATVDGKAWAANMSNNSFKSPALGGITTSNGISIMVVLGIYANNKDTSAFAVLFPQSTTLNQTTVFDISKFTEAAYISETAAGSAVYNGYNTTGTTGGSGNFSVTTFDQTNKIIEGTFSGTFGATSGTAKVQVTNGKFRCPYTTDISQINNLSGLKF